MSKETYVLYFNEVCILCTDQFFLNHWTFKCNFINFADYFSTKYGVINHVFHYNFNLKIRQKCGSLGRFFFNFKNNFTFSIACSCISTEPNQSN